MKGNEEVDALRRENTKLSRELNYLREQLNDLTRRLYGRRSERFEDPNQLKFFEDPPEPEKAPEPSRETIEYTRKKPRAMGPKPLPEHLPRDRVEIDPGIADRTCACCTKVMERVDEVVTEELTVKPPEFRVTEFVRGKWQCKECMSGTVEKPLPPRPIERGRPSPSLLAYIIVAKWIDHTPLYRQEQIFKRYGFPLRRSTMDDWLGKIAELLRPIVDSQRRRLLKLKFLQSDDTRIQVLDKKVKGKSQRCYLWSYGIPHGEVVYDFTKSRSARGPREFLESFSGHLQCDGYAAYGDVFRRSDVEHIACMAHIRRKFFEAQDAQPERVAEVLKLIRQLYDIETEAREEKLSLAERADLRARRAPSLLDTLKKSMEAIRPYTTPKSKLGRAVEYAHSEWPAMLRYLDCPEAELDNNQCENSMRPVVIGRKNFLFLGSEEGGSKRAEVFFSLAQSAKRLDLNPFTYLADVIERISTHPHARLDELTPHGWKEARARAENASS